jgi:ABC-2 type transport system permease protein
MSGLMTICRKELSDHLGSKRYILLFALIVSLSVASAYQGADFIKNNPMSSFVVVFSGAGDSSFSFIYLMVIFGPIIGLALGFDAINRERTRGSLSVILSQPIFRDSILNGKFIAGVAALSLLAVSTIGILTGVAIPILGFGPAGDEILRIGLFTLFTILYLSIWLALGLLFSIMSKNTTTSILMSISTWLIFSIIITIAASFIADVASPIETPTGFQAITIPANRTFSGGFDLNQSFGGSRGFLDQTQMTDYMEAMENNANIEAAVQKISPCYLYEDASTSLLGIAEGGFGAAGNPFRGLEATQSVSSSWPQVTVLAVVLIACFVSSYMVFLRQEIRAGG